MKKSITSAVSQGLVLLALSQAALADGVEYKITWDAAAERYRVLIIPDATPQIQKAISSQVTIRFPKGTFSEKLSNSAIGLTTAPAHQGGVVWSASSWVFSPPENPSWQYLSFTASFAADDTILNLQKDVEQEIFSFHTDGVCEGAVSIMDNDSDPFADGAYNSGNEFSHLYWDAGNDFLGVAGQAADCKAASGNSNPVANSDSVSAVEDEAVAIDVLANDTDADNDNLTISGKTDGNNGTVTLVNDASLTYSPDAGFVGNDDFTYTITDGEGGSATTIVYVSVTAKQSTNNAPVAVADTAAVQAGGQIEIDVLANDTDADGDSLTLEAVDSATYGTASLQNDQILYIADSGSSGSDSFSYTISDGKTQSKGIVTVTVSSPSDNDGDGLSNEDEAALGTDPDLADTDGDGINDRIEVGANASAPLDTDRDGFIDALDEDDDNDTILTIYEVYDGGSPRNTDSDRDGTPDYLDPDDDNDGLLTAQESPDQNGDGNPADAYDSDSNGKPDYLQRPGKDAPVTQEAIPTLTQWAQILLSLLLGLVALGSYLRKNH